MNVFSFLNHPQFQKAKQSNNHYYFGNVFSNTPTWGVVDRCLVEALTNGWMINQIKETVQIIECFNVKEVNDFCKAIYLQDKSKKFSVHLYTTQDESAPFDNHKDEVDVYFWQGEGSTNWKVTTPEGVKEYDLVTGDLIYIPKDTYHHVSSLSPRFGFSISVE